jgi:hypothetical protein
VTPDGSWMEGQTIIEKGQTIPETHPNKSAFEKV